MKKTNLIQKMMNHEINKEVMDSRCLFIGWHHAEMPTSLMKKRKQWTKDLQNEDRNL